MEQDQHISIPDEDALRKLFQHIQKEYQNRGRWQKEIWRPSGEIVQRSVITNFEEGGRPKKWKRRASGYKRSELSHLTDEAMLKNSIRYQLTDSRQVGGVKVGVLKGPATAYAATVQLGVPGDIIKPKRGKWLRFPLRSIRSARRSVSQRVRKKWQWVTVKQVRVVRRPYLLFQRMDVKDIMNRATEFYNEVSTGK